MLNFEFSRTSRKCSVTDRAFEGGEEFYSALVWDEGKAVRIDVAVDAWTGEPEECIGWWKSRMPDLQKGKVYWAPNHVLLSYFEQLLERKGSEDIAFVMALVLTQKRLLKLIDTDDTQNPSVMVLRQNSTKATFHVPSVDVTESRIKTIQSELADQLFTDHAPNDEEGDGAEGSQDEVK